MQLKSNRCNVHQPFDAYPSWSSDCCGNLAKPTGPSSFILAKPNYFQRVNRDLLDRIPLTAQTVLEVGCGSGALGAAFKRRQPKVLYIGIEAMAQPAAEARHVLDQVLQGDVEDPSLEVPSFAPLDCLIYGDVLEHLRDPWTCLKRQSQWLSDDGVLLACIPNVQHWSVLLELMNGRWPLRDEGLFDRTHLRWFTRSGIEAMIQEAGLHLHDCHPRIFQADKAKEFSKRLQPALNSLGIDFNQFHKDSSPLQYVIRAGRHPREALTINILITLKNFSSHGDVRLKNPARNLTSLPKVKVYTGSKFELHPKDDPTPRIILWQRPTPKRGNEFHIKNLKTLVNEGHLVIADIDDDPSSKPWSEQDYFAFRSVHAVQTSTQQIADVIRTHNPEVFVSPNNLASLGTFKPKKRPGDRLRLFFGALNRQQDWAPWLPALNEIFAASPDSWEVSVIHDKSFYNSIKLPKGQITFTPTCELATYQTILSESDITFLPLNDTPFNRFKSDLSAIEAAGRGLAVLASPTVYAETVRHGLPAALFNSKRELLNIMKSWQDDPDRVRLLGKKAQRWVAQHRMQADLVKPQEHWYRDLWHRKDELTRRVHDREPTLRPGN